MTDPALAREADLLCEAATHLIKAADYFLRAASAVRSNDRPDADAQLRSAHEHTESVAQLLDDAERVSHL